MQSKHADSRRVGDDRPKTLGLADSRDLKAQHRLGDLLRLIGVAAWPESRMTSSCASLSRPGRPVWRLPASLISVGSQHQHGAGDGRKLIRTVNQSAAGGAAGRRRDRFGRALFDAATLLPLVPGGEQLPGENARQSAGPRTRKSRSRVAISMRKRNDRGTMSGPLLTMTRLRADRPTHRQLEASMPPSRCPQAWIPDRPRRSQKAARSAANSNVVGTRWLVAAPVPSDIRRDQPMLLGESRRDLVPVCCRRAQTMQRQQRRGQPLFLVVQRNLVELNLRHA